MQSEADWLSSQEDPASPDKYNYFLMRDPNMKEFTGPPEEEYDALTGKIATVRQTRIGMVRGQKPENMRGVKVYLAFDGERCIPHYRVDNPKPLQGWYQSGDEARKGSRPRPCEADAVLTQPYGGSCAVGCIFCYVDNGIYGARGSGLMTVPVNYGDYVKKRIAQMHQAAPFYLSSFTEPFLPLLEGFYHNTENAMREIARAGLPMFTLSRMRYPGWAFDLLSQNRYSYAQASVNTPSEDDWKKLSPGAASLAERMEDIRELRRKGIYVSIQVNPIIGGITTHDEVEELLEMLAEAGTNHVITKFVETSQPSAKAMVARMTKRFGDNRAALFSELFTENNAGAQKTIVEEYRREGFERYRRKATQLGMTYSLCYEYQRDPNHPTGWRSMGPDYKTTPNCHGQTNAMYTRHSLEEPFHLVENCAPSGCLNCATDNGGQPRCGDALAGLAKAKVWKDFKQPIGV